MKITPLEIPEVLLIETPVFADNRGSFNVAYSVSDYADAGLPEFVQDNHAYSVKNVIRAFHYQYPHPQAKLVRCVTGAIFDVVVDIRSGSPTFGKYVSVELREGDGKQLYVPVGFAHGFYTLGDNNHVIMKVGEVFYPSDNNTFVWNDPDIGVKWPLLPGAEGPIMNENDSNALRLCDIPADRLPKF